MQSNGYRMYLVGCMIQLSDGTLDSLDYMV